MPNGKPMRVRVLFSLVALLLLHTVAASSGLSDDEQRMVDWIDANSESAIDLLEETVNISSGTMNLEGVREVGVVCLGLNSSVKKRGVLF